MLNEIQTGRYNGVLGKLLGMKQTPAPLLGTDIFPTLALEVDRPEWAFLGGVRLAAGYISDAAVAGQFSHVALRNPTASDVLCVVRSIEAYAGSTAYLTIGIRAQTTLDATSAGAARDSRWSTAGAFASKCVLGTYTNAVAAPGATQWGLVVTASGFNHLPVPWVLSPGFELIMVPNAANVLVGASFEWYERPLLPSERR